LEVNFHRGFFLGSTETLLQIYNWDLVSLRVKQAYTVKYDECSMVMDCPSPNSRHVRGALDGKYIPAETQEYGAPAAFDLVSSACPFIKLKVLGLRIHCDHDTFSIETVDCADLNRAYISNMTPHSTGTALHGWRRNYADVYIVEVDRLAVFNSDDFARVCATLFPPFTGTPRQPLP
jgi:hypothetical protein